ncbi:MAG TPA: Tm-1-like ATP-binding domain-containing protein [Candidatus Limnocylindrales bacterium]|nr:Tm-1-like ATP-binding domain-containing protein [Candidatus Limnocylindrales bacterium]
MATVVLVGTLDTKGLEYDFLRKHIQGAGCDVIMVDVGPMGQTKVPADVTADEVATAAGADRAALVAAGDRGPAVATMTRGAIAIAQKLHAEHRLDAIAGLGGSGGSSIISAVMQALPVGVPKLLVSTMASGDTRPYVGTTDIAMMYSVVDVAGINGISEKTFSNAAAMIAGAAIAAAGFVPTAEVKPLLGATMFGVTTPCVTAAREILEAKGYEVLVFHATGAGGRSMEALMRGGFIKGVLDITTTELADELVGGVLSAGPDRLEMAGSLGLPQVVSLGALDMVNFGPVDTVPAAFKGRLFYEHNATVTLMRTTPAENAELGRIIARKLNAATGPLAVFIPLKGVSMIDVEGMPFFDPVADAALFDALRADLRPEIEVHEVETDINDPAFAAAMAEKLDSFYRTATQQVERIPVHA